MTRHHLHCLAAAALMSFPGVPRAADDEGPANPSNFRLAVDTVRIEAARYQDQPLASGGLFSTATPNLGWRPARGWEVKAGVVLTAQSQSGGTGQGDYAAATPADTYVRHRIGDLKLTAGWQTVVWGRLDEFSMIDRVSRVDLTRFLIDPLSERRLALPAVRIEHLFGSLSFDLVSLPDHHPARLGRADGVWHPLDQTGGRIAGLALPAPLAAFVSAARLREDDVGSGGAALRVRHTGDGGLDLGFVVARTRQAVPYFRADPAAQSLTQVHPFNRFVGVDFEAAALGMTWRGELGRTLDVPATTPAGRQVEGQSTAAALGVETFLFDDMRVNLQLSSHRLFTPIPVLEARKVTALGGEVMLPMDRGRWNLGLKFASSLNRHDVYVGPRISFKGWEPHELYLAYHHFDGAVGTIGNYYARNRSLSLGLSTRF